MIINIISIFNFNTNARSLDVAISTGLQLADMFYVLKMVEENDISNDQEY